ncbi:SusC/RagA family TonB-linked outer membrane protein [Hymenobacter bucti]|uniref:SusC/RagA family TonB-linked outer membrane protein n=1 Tax=Hymenobacter bucti TaxID=1844114 RepID=A0ABW4QUX0_9BACT
MKRTLLMSSVLMVTMCQAALAQTRAVSGRVTDQKTGEGIPGVTVLLKGTTNGASTNSDGTFSLTIPAVNGTLVFSSIGYVTQERIIGKEDQVNITLNADAKELNEVVVTALGIEKDVRSLGYATQEVKAEDISQQGTPNVLEALQGKVAGLSISSASGLAGASSNVQLRGITSFGGSNQPLFVVDGIPISNDLNSTGGGSLGTLGASQTSNRALDIDPENVESVNVLKGPTAAALYGSRAASGAIIITTKGNRGARNKKLEVNVTSSFNLQQVYGLPTFQNEYGAGTSGTFPTAGTGNIFASTSNTSSWGPRFGTTPTTQNGLLLSDGTTAPYQAYPNNIKDFYRLGRLLTNGVNIAGGDATRNVSLNVNNSNQQGITENSSLDRTSVQLSANTQLVNKLRVGGSVNFISSSTVGPQIGNGSSAFGQLVSVPRSYDLNNSPYQTAAGTSQFFAGSDNPIWNLRNNPTTSDLTRFISVANLGYDIRPWLSVQYRLGYDTYTDRRRQVYALTSARLPTGQVLDQSFYRSELNGDLLINLKKDDIFVKGLNANLLLGNNINSRRAQTISSQADALTLPGFYNSANGTVFSNGTGESSSLRRIVGYYSQLSLAYNNYLFLELTGRADQTSTLAPGNNTFFYPAATLSFVFTDAFKISNDFFSYGKVRGNISQVGRDASPYQIYTNYSVVGLGNNVASLSFPFNGVSGFGVQSALGGGATLTPEFTKSYEAGVDLGFFNNRLMLNLTAYKTVSENQIFSVTVPTSTGYFSRIANVGRMDNKGFEALVNITPVRTSAFRWDVTANYSLNRNNIVRISEGVNQASVAGNAFTGTIPSIVVGQPYGVIVGNAKQRDPATGQYLIDPTNGLFLPEATNQVISNPQPKWQGGITNTFNYKGFTLSALVDAVVGGQLVSFTEGFYKSRGALTETGVNREAPRVIPGVIVTSRDGSGAITATRPNNIQVDAQSYWSSFGLQSDLNVYDASVYRLRELALGYTVPKEMLGRLPFGSVSVQILTRNLLYYAPNTGFDPQINTQGAGNIQGLDLQGPPNTRTYGATLRFSL